MSNESAAAKQYVASIDAGTSSVRVILFTKNGEIAFVEQKELTLDTPKSGWVEQSAEEIYVNITECMEKLLGNNKIDMKQIVSVGITNQRETTVLWDATTGKPVHKAIVWQDTRTANIVNEMSDALGSKDALRSKCGLPLSTYFSATKIKWLFENNSDVAALAKNKQLKFGTVDCWLIWNLVGNNSHFIDVSNASRTMLMNLQTLDWDPTLCETFNIPQHILPRIVPSSFNYGVISDGPFTGLPLCGCIGDQQAATLGQMCLNPGDVKNTYGTGAFLIFNTGTQIVPSQHGLLTTVLWQFDDEKSEALYALEGSVAVAGQAIKFLRDNLKIIKSAKECDEIAAKYVEVVDDQKNGDEIDEDRIYFVTAFSGLYSPYWRNDARGLIYGLTMHTQRDNICRAVMEATCFRTCEIIEAMKQDTEQFGIELNSLKVDGGMAQSDITLQIQADLLQIPVRRPSMIETTALGAAIVAGIKVGFWQNLDEVKKCVGKNMNEFKPNISANKAKRLKDGWEDAIQRCFKNEKKKESTCKCVVDGTHVGAMLIGFAAGVAAYFTYLRATGTKTK